MKYSKTLYTLATSLVAVTLLSGYKWDPNNTSRYLPEFFCPDASNNGDLSISNDYEECFNDCKWYSDTDKYCDYTDSVNKNNRGVPKALAKAISNKYSGKLDEVRFTFVDKTVSGKSVYDIKDEYLKTFPELDETVPNGNLYLDDDKGLKISYGFAEDSKGKRVHNGVSITKNNTHIKVTFIAETAALANTLAYFTYKMNSDGMPTDMEGNVINGNDYSNRSRLNEIVLYPNYSAQIGDPSEVDKDDASKKRPLGSADSLVTGQTAILGPFDAGTEVGFVVIAGGYDRKDGVDPLYGWTYQLGSASGQTVGDKPLYEFFHKHIHDFDDSYEDRGHWFYYSLPELNREVGSSNIDDRRRAHAVSLYTVTDNVDYPYYIIGFEDYPNNHTFGDRDMNDLILMIESVEPGGITKECTDLNLSQDGLQCEEITCATVDPTAPDSVKNETLKSLGLSNDPLDFDGDGIANSEEPGMACIPSPVQCYDETLVNLSGVAAGGLLFHDKDAVVYTPDYTTNGLSLNQDMRAYQVGYDSSNYTKGIMSALKYDTTLGFEQDDGFKVKNDQSKLLIRNLQDLNSSVLKPLSIETLPTEAIQQRFVMGDTPTQALTGDELTDMVQEHIAFHKANTLGPIYNSNPLYIGSPGSFYQFANYVNFKSNNDKRTPHVYVAANDGKLHAVNATNGQETFAYIPQSAFSDLYKVKLQNNEPLFVNDGKLIAADISLGDVKDDGSNWRTVLIGMQGGAGHGMYALDVTKPEAPKLQWELSASDIEAAITSLNPSLGYTLADPVVVKAGFKKDGSVDELESRWVMIVGNGYYAGSYADHSDVTNGLLIVDIQTGQFMYLPVAGSVTQSEAGLGSPAAIDFDSDGLVDLVYVGSLNGKLWKFDLRNYSFQAKQVVSTATSVALFDTEGLPITTAPNVVRYSADKVQVVFGTGKYFESGDDVAKTGANQVNAIFSIRDEEATPTNTLTKAKLSKGEISYEVTDDTAGTGFEAFRLFNNDVNYASTYGWYLPLQYGGNYLGEMVVEKGVYVEGVSRAFSSQKAGLLFSTLLVESDTAQCNHSGWIMAFDPFTGKALDGIDFKSDGINVSDTVTKDGKQYQVIGGKLDGRVGAGSNLVADGKDSNQFSVDGKMQSLDAASKPEGRMNLRVIETEN